MATENKLSWSSTDAQADSANAVTCSFLCRFGVLDFANQTEDRGGSGHLSIFTVHRQSHSARELNTTSDTTNVMFDVHLKHEIIGDTTTVMFDPFHPDDVSFLAQLSSADSAARLRQANR